MATEARVRAARDLHRFLGDADVHRDRAGLGVALDALREVVAFDCAHVVEWDAATQQHATLASRDYPPAFLRLWEDHLSAEPTWQNIPVGGRALRVRDVAPRDRGGIIWEETYVQPGFAEGFALRLWTVDERYVGCVNAAAISAAQPDDLAVDLLDLLAPRLASALDPIGALRPRTDDLAAGRAEGLVVTRHGHVRRLTDAAHADLARLDGPLWPMIWSVVTGRSHSLTAVVLVATRVLLVSLHAGKHGVLVLHRTVPAPFGLSIRELQILDALAGGATNRDLATRFGIAPRTVATYVERLLAKTGCPNRTAATRLATRLNLIVC